MRFSSERHFAKKGRESEVAVELQRFVWFLSKPSLVQTISFGHNDINP